MRRFVVIIGLVFIGFGLFAQEESVMDTINIEEVVTYGSYKKFQAGSKIEALSPEQISSVQEGGIEQLLMRFTPVYVKTNAGGLATVHIRGTAADHTSIMFGGINVNSLTLGHSDLSSITSFLFDKMELQYGSSAALNGSGAIGGAIYLGTQNRWTDGVRISAKYSLGSFGERLYGTKIYLGNGKWESVTKLLKYETDNDFPYMNYSGFGNENGVKEIQQNAAINNKGIIQEFNYLFGANEYFKSAFWYADNWHEIQPSMGDASEVVTELKNEDIRAWGEYLNENHILKFNLGAGYVRDKQIYNNDPGQRIQTNRFITDLSVKQQVLKTLEYKAGVKYKYIVPDVYSYSDSAELNEHDADFYLTFFYQPITKLKTTVNLRQQWVSNYNAPFTPALGIEYNWIRKSENKFASLFNISKSYRVPTLNDRYWPTPVNPLGTPDLKPEDGFTVETGIKHNYDQEDFKSVIKLNVFYLHVKNWLEWRNNNGSIPVNLEKVVSKGVELHANATLKTGEFISTLTGNYTYNPSTKIEDGKPDQQLIYIPHNMFNAYYQLKYRDLLFLIDGSYTGERYYYYITKSNQVRKTLDSYFLTNCVLRYSFKLMEQDFAGAFSVNNVFNVSYQNQRNYAMPGINFRLSITANINL